MKLFVLFMCCIAVSFSAVLPAEDNDIELPEGATPCAQDDPNLNDCIKESVGSMIPKLHKGSKELNIPPLDPFGVKESRFSYGQSGFNSNFVLKDIKVYGMSKAEVKDVNVNITEDNINSRIVIYFPRLFTQGGYKGNIILNGIKMNPRGYFNLTLTDLTVVHSTTGSLEFRNGKQYLKLEKYDVDPEIGNLEFYGTGLFPDPKLNDIAIDFINQYWPSIFKIASPEVRKAIEPIILEPANAFLSRVPIEVMLPKTLKQNNESI